MRVGLIALVCVLGGAAMYVFGGGPLSEWEAYVQILIGASAGGVAGFLAGIDRMRVEHSVDADFIDSERGANLSLMDADPEFAAQLGMTNVRWRPPVPLTAGSQTFRDYHLLEAEAPAYLGESGLPPVPAEDLMAAPVEDEVDGWEVRHPDGWPDWLYLMCRQYDDETVDVYGFIEKRRHADRATSDTEEGQP